MPFDACLDACYIDALIFRQPPLITFHRCFISLMLPITPPPFRRHFHAAFFSIAAALIADAADAFFSFDFLLFSPLMTPPDADASRHLSRHITFIPLIFSFHADNIFTPPPRFIFVFASFHDVDFIYALPPYASLTHACRHHCLRPFHADYFL